RREGMNVTNLGGIIFTEEKRPSIAVEDEFAGLQHANSVSASHIPLIAGAGEFGELRIGLAVRKMVGLIIRARDNEPQFTFVIFPPPGVSELSVHSGSCPSPRLKIGSGPCRTIGEIVNN